MKGTAIHNLQVATISDIARLEEMVQAAYRGGKATVDWKNEHHLVTGPRITAAGLNDHINDPNATIITARTERNDAITGCVLVEKHSDAEAHIGMLAVDPNSQNTGLGRVLLEAAAEHARDHFACSKAVMFVLSGREELIGWYKRLGYEETGDTVPFSLAGDAVTAHDENAHFRVISKEGSVPMVVEIG